MTRVNSEELRAFLIREILEENGASPVSSAAARFKVSRVTANRYLTELVSEGFVNVKGQGQRDRQYSVVKSVEDSCTVTISETIREEEVWRRFNWLFEDRSGEEKNICFYGATEMINNALEHSDGTTLTVAVQKNLGFIEIVIDDDGVGIFDKVAKAMNLPNPEDSLLELAKGKLTTDPSHHSGEGIFFTSRSFDEFSILSGSLFFSRKSHQDDTDWLYRFEDRSVQGTHIKMRLFLPCKHTLSQIFKAHRVDLNAGFSRTTIPLLLAKAGGELLVSRSQAKRVLDRVSRFKEVVLDFTDVESIGQGFADEVFRVFATEHPDVHFSVIGANEDVLAMIAHVKSSR